MADGISTAEAALRLTLGSIRHPDVVAQARWLKGGSRDGYSVWYDEVPETEEGAVKYWLIFKCAPCAKGGS